MPTNSDRSYRFPQVAQSTVKRIANRALLGASSFLVLLVAMVLTAPGREGGQPDRASAPNGTVEPPIRHQQWRLDVLRIRQTDTVGDPPSTSKPSRKRPLLSCCWRSPIAARKRLPCLAACSSRTPKGAPTPVEARGQHSPGTTTPSRLTPKLRRAMPARAGRLRNSPRRPTQPADLAARPGLRPNLLHRSRLATFAVATGASWNAAVPPSRACSMPWSPGCFCPLLRSSLALWLGGLLPPKAPRPPLAPCSRGLSRPLAGSTF